MNDRGCVGQFHRWVFKIQCLIMEGIEIAEEAAGLFGALLV